MYEPIIERFQRVVLVHYHEIGLKGHNRSNFEKRLQANLHALLFDFPVVTIHRISGRLVIFLKEGTTLDLANSCADLTANIPGVARVSCGFKCPRTMEDIASCALFALAQTESFETFKVQARRNHTDFEVDSMQMNRDIGEILCEAYPDKKVKMKDPDVTVNIEVIQNSAFVLAQSKRGIGGLPVGSSGRMVCLLSSGIDSPVALWRMARRGAVCIGVHFSGRPQSSDESEYLVGDIAKVLQQTGCIARVYTFPLGNFQHKIALSCPPKLRVLLYRRLMFRVAERVAKLERAGALVTGESLGQVASQTMENLMCTNNAVTLPVFRPLIGMDKLEIINQAQKLGTFEISTQDAPDCCTLFMPRSPETHGKLNEILAAEEQFPIEDWIEELMTLSEVYDCNSPSYKYKK